MASKKITMVRKDPNKKNRKFNINRKLLGKIFSALEGTDIQPSNFVSKINNQNPGGTMPSPSRDGRENQINFEEGLEEDIEFSKMIEKQDADGEELIRTEDVMRYYLSEEGKQKYEIAYSKDVLEKDFPAIPPTVKSRIIKAIEEKLTTDPLKAGIPLRGKLKKD